MHFVSRLLPGLALSVVMAWGAEPDQETFAGRWNTTFGPMSLEGTGDQARGTYGFGEELIGGSVDGERFLFEYDGGEGEFTLWTDGDTFTGTYRSTQGERGSWGGYRLEAKVAEPVAGEVSTGQSQSGLNYHLRVPKDFTPARRYPAIAFLHGSNMSSRDYIDTIAARWPALADDYLLVGFDGERLSGASKPGRRVFNYTYVNFSGPGRGPLWAQRQSPALVAEALEELQGQLLIDHWFLGGHSQGGFLTYAVFMFYPERVAGVFPMSCNLLVQCEPDFFKDEALRSKQRQVAIAVVHGENDPTVPFSGGEYCYRRMIDGGFPTVHFWKHPTAGHMFARLPVYEAVRWLETLTSTNVDGLVAFARDQVEAGAYRDALTALSRLGQPESPSQAKEAEALHAKINEAAQAEADRLLETIRSNENGDWVEAFLKFREQFALASAARETMAAYAQLREQQADPADKLFYAARRTRGSSERNDIYRELIQKYYASKWYELVRDWVDE